MQLIKRYEFWNYRDTRKETFPPLRPPSLPPVETNTLRPVTGLISHHILLPLAELPQPLVNRLKADLTFRNPEFEKAREYGKGFVSYAIPEFVRFYSMDTIYLGLPRSVKQTYLNNRFRDCGLELHLRDIRPEFERLTWREREFIRPYFYQNEAIERLSNQSMVLKFRCGKGKTMMALLSTTRIRLKTLIIVRTRILLKQWVEAIKNIYDVHENEIGIMWGKTKREGPITVAMEQTLVNLPRSEKRRLGEIFGQIIFDEAHETPAPTYRELLTYFKARYCHGLSATPYRSDGMDPVLKLYIGPIVEIDDLGEFETRIYLRKTNFRYHFEGKKDKYHELIKALIHNHDRNHIIVTDVQRFVLEGRLVVVYSNRIEHMEILERMVQERMPGVRTDILASRKNGVTLTIEDQERVREYMRSGQLDAVAGGKIIEQGFDCPPLEVAILATPTKSKRLIEQVLGRCQRECLGKKEAILVDYIDEHVRVLLYQFYSKNRNLYKKYWKVYD